MRALCWLVFLTSFAVQGAELVYHVSPAHLHKTLEAALQAARAERGTNSARIVIQGGRYELTEPITLGPADSRLTVVGQGARPVLSGGRRITGWQRDPANPNLWRARMPERGWAFRQLFVDGRRAVRAKSPNEAFFRIQGASPQDQPARLKFKAGDIKKEHAGRDIEVIALLAWADLRMQIMQVDEATHTAILSGNPRPSNKENDARYFLENAAEFLDAPGEWFLDRAMGVVTYYARLGEDLARAEVIAPVLQDLITIQGSAEQPVENIRFENLEFSHTDWALGPNGYADTQAAVATRGEIRAEFARWLAFENCRFSRLAGYALDFGAGAQGCSVTRCEMVDLGGGGIRIGESTRPQSPAHECHSHTVAENEMHQLGRVYYPAVGVFILHSATNRIARNHIHDLYYTAISVGWNWGYRDSPCRANIIEFNHLHDIGQDMLSDMGGVYTLGPQPGTIIRNNVIHDVSSFNYGGWGLYTDEGSTGIILEHNIVYRCKDAGFHQHYGRENIVRNNIFALNRKNQLMRTRPEPHISFIFTNNIVYFDSGNLLGSNWSNDHYVMDRNLYYDTRGAENIRLAGISLEEWKKRGHDTNSIIVDPKFADPARGDFTLAPDSPAFALGFKRIVPLDSRRR